GIPNVVVNRWYGWDGEAYVDISSTLDESYYPLIANDYWRTIEASAGCWVPDHDTYQLLADYYSIGKVAEAWERLEPLLRWDECSEDDFDGAYGDPDEFLQWIEHLMAQERKRSG